MRLHRFYMQTPIHDETFDVADRDMVHQWKHVFRYNVGSQVILFDGSGFEYLCIISSIRALGATVSVLRKKDIGTVVPRAVWLGISVIKRDNVELAVQKATELGVVHIVPILSEHSEKKKINIERLHKIAVEASEQSGRASIPEIEPATTLKDLFSRGALPQEKIVLDPTGLSFRDYLRDKNPSSIVVFIGPEGGWSEKEIAFFRSYNVPVLTLGTQILRAETAAIAAAGLLLL